MQEERRHGAAGGNNRSMNSSEMVLAGRYGLREVLGDGGVGRVYRAEDSRLRRTVAIKTLQPHYDSEPQLAHGFEREAQLAGSLAHPHIVAIYDVDVADGAPYIVMEYVAGGSLRLLLANGGPPPLARTLAIIRQLADALDTAHQHGVIHRDVKPENILLTPAGDVKMSDFGIARALGDLSQTTTGLVLGSVSYLSPEQAQGQPATSASDLYSLGVVLYELLTGQPPFRGESPVVTALQHVTHNPPLPTSRIPSLPPGLDGVMLTALAKDPRKRYPSGAALAAALAGAISAPQPADVQPGPAWSTPAIATAPAWSGPGQSGRPQGASPPAGGWGQTSGAGWQDGRGNAAPRAATGKRLWPGRGRSRATLLPVVLLMGLGGGAYAATHPVPPSRVAVSADVPPLLVRPHARLADAAAMKQAPRPLTRVALPRDRTARPIGMSLITGLSHRLLALPLHSTLLTWLQRLPHQRRNPTRHNDMMRSQPATVGQLGPPGHDGSAPAPRRLSPQATLTTAYGLGQSFVPIRPTDHFAADAGWAYIVARWSGLRSDQRVALRWTMPAGQHGAYTGCVSWWTVCYARIALPERGVYQVEFTVNNAAVARRAFAVLDGSATPGSAPAVTLVAWQP